jgi:aspartate aminotransferase-like enzyme
MTKQMISHRGEEFKEIIERITLRLKEFYQTKGDVFVLTGSGTGGLEAAVVNMLSPGDKVLVVSIGVFGERFGSIAEQFGADVKYLRFEWGHAADPEAIEEALKSDPSIKAVLATHNETSTGITNDLEKISSVVKRYDKLLLVDAVSSLSSINLPVDDWKCDVVVSGSQKGWMVPPGLSFVSVSEKAWQAHAEAKMPRFYWDFSKAKSFLEKGQTPWTPALPIFFALDVALDRMAKEGLQNIFARHAQVAQKTREGVKSLGFPLFADPKYASNTVTAVASPNNFDTAAFLKTIREKHGIVLAGGQQRLKGKIFRIGHLGFVTESDIDELLEAFHIVLQK